MYIQYMEALNPNDKNTYELTKDYLGPFTDYKVEGGGLKVYQYFNTLGLYPIDRKLPSKLYDKATHTF